MPNPNKFGKWALTAQFDARRWSGVTVAEIDGETITFPTYAAGEGIYMHAAQFLNGNGQPLTQFTPRTFEQDFKDGWQAAGGDPADVSVVLTSQDKISIIIPNDAGLVLQAHADNRFWGFDTAGQTASYAGTSMVAVNDWRREVISNGLTTDAPRLTFYTTNVVGAQVGASWKVPKNPLWIQNALVHLRGEFAEMDAIDNSVSSPSFQQIINSAISPNSGRVRIVMLDNGHVAIVSSRALGLDPLDWLDTSFRDALGFSGNEEMGQTGASDANDVNYVIADYPMPTMIIPNRCIVRLDPTHETVGEVLRLTDGSYSSVKIGDYYSWRLDFKLQGPAEGVDEHQHYLRRVLPYMPRGYPVALWQDWNDPRLRLFSWDVNYSQPAYDLTYNSQGSGYQEGSGYHGVLLCRVSEEQEQETSLSWTGFTRQFTDVTLILSEREGLQSSSGPSPI